MCGSDIFLGIIAILFPPLAVWVKRGICSADSLINILLCTLGFLPGLIHAWYIIAVTPDPTYTEVQDPESGQVTYYYVQSQPHYGPQGRQGRPQGGYGTVNSNSTPNAQFPAPQKGFVQPPAQQPRAQAQAGPSDEVPPSYQQATGDHKVQGP